MKASVQTSRCVSGHRTLALYCDAWLSISERRKLPRTKRGEDEPSHECLRRWRSGTKRRKGEPSHESLHHRRRGTEPDGDGGKLKGGSHDGVRLSSEDDLEAVVDDFCDSPSRAGDSDQRVNNLQAERSSTEGPRRACTSL